MFYYHFGHRKNHVNLYGNRAHRARVFPGGQLHIAWAADTKSKQATVGYSPSGPPENDRPMEYISVMKDTGLLQQIFMNSLCAKRSVRHCEEGWCSAASKVDTYTHVCTHACTHTHTYESCPEVTRGDASPSTARGHSDNKKGYSQAETTQPDETANMEAKMISSSI